MMNIKPSAAIRKHYNEVSELCKRTGEPVYLTKNGEGDLVVMDMETYARRESMLLLREKLVAHVRFAALVSEETAQRLIEEFEEKTKSLEILPERNPWLDDPLISNCRQDYGWLL